MAREINKMAAGALLAGALGRKALAGRGSSLWQIIARRPSSAESARGSRRLLGAMPTPRGGVIALRQRASPATCANRKLGKSKLPRRRRWPESVRDVMLSKSSK